MKIFLVTLAALLLAGAVVISLKSKTAPVNGVRPSFGAIGKVKSWFAKEPQFVGVAEEAPPTAEQAGVAATPRRVVTMTRDVSVHIKYGIVGLRRGTKVALVSHRGPNVQVRDRTGATLVVPVSATDLR